MNQLKLNLLILKRLKIRYTILCLLIFIYGCVGSSFLCEGFLQLRQAGATLHRGAQAFHYHGLSCCGAQAPDVQAQQLWLMGPAAPQHVGFSQTRARTRVPYIGRQILNHCATREAPPYIQILISENWQNSSNQMVGQFSQQYLRHRVILRTLEKEKFQNV